MNLKRWQVAVAVAVVLAVVGLLTLRSRSNTNEGSEPAGAPVLGERTKTQGCTIRTALPDRECTPGAVFADVTKEQICRPGYAKSVRNVPDRVKDQVHAEYGIRSHRPGEYEVDHLVSLELGGSNDIANLWPQAAEPRRGSTRRTDMRTSRTTRSARGRSHFRKRSGASPTTG